MSKEKDEHRKYYNGNIEIPSCTTIVGLLNKPELVGWANKLGFKQVNALAFRDHRAEYGTHCHKLFEQYFMGTTMPTVKETELLSKIEYQELMYKFESIEIFLESVNAKILNMELAMEGKTYGGTLDMIIYDEVDDCIVILDLKTSKAIRQSHWIQLMGYAGLVEEIYGLPVRGVGVILLSKSGDDPDEMVTVRDTIDCWRERQVFNKLRDIYYFLNKTPEEIAKLRIRG